MGGWPEGWHQGLLRAWLDRPGEERPGTKEFIKRGNAADLKYPIIVFKLKSGKLLIMDGVHRLWKAKDAGDETIKGHILTQKEAEKFKWKDGKGVMVSFT